MTPLRGLIYAVFAAAAVLAIINLAHPLPANLNLSVMCFDVAACGAVYAVLRHRQRSTS